MKTKVVLLTILAMAIIVLGVAADPGLVSNAVFAVTILPAILTDAQGNEIPPMTRAQKKAFDYLRMKGNAITLDSYRSGALKWDNVTYYIRKVITGLAGRQILLNASTSYLVGACNLDKGQLPQFYNFAYDRIEVGEVINNTSASLTVQNMSGYSSVLSSMDAALRNGHLIVLLNREVQVETAITDFGSKGAVVGGGARDFDGGELSDPQVWQEQLQVQCDVDLAGTVASAANTTYAIEVLFKGVQFRLR